MENVSNGLLQIAMMVDVVNARCTVVPIVTMNVPTISSILTWDTALNVAGADTNPQTI
jgi:hypothetical protein